MHEPHRARKDRKGSGVYLVQVFDISDNSNPGGVPPVFNDYSLWREKHRTTLKSEALEAKEILQHYYVRVRILVTREAVELTDDMQELL